MLDFILSIIPILWLVISLCVIKMPGWKACGLTAGFSAAIAVLWFRMTLPQAGSAIVEGILNALWPICTVIIAALFVYNLVLETKAMDTIKAMLSSVSSNPMIILLIIGWGFGNFLEGMAGFGTAVAIPTGILVAMGYDPIKTLVACLIANSTPTAFGSVGVPTSTVAAVTGLNALTISGDIAMMQVILTLLSPFLMILISGGEKSLRKMWKFTLLASLSFTVPQVITAIFVGPELPNIIGSVVCLAACVFTAIRVGKNERKVNVNIAMQNLNIKEILIAWSQFILIFLVLFFTSSLFPNVHKLILSVSSQICVYTGENPGVLSFAWLDCPGVKIFLCGLVGGLIQQASLSSIINVFFRTLKANCKTIITICSVLATAKTMGYSGMITSIATVLVAITGSMYPFISPAVGMIGGFVTGSGTSTGVLFGPLQATTADVIGISKEWLSAGNMMGGGIGKMISPQNLAIGCAAAGLNGKESDILSITIKYALIFATIGGIICMVGA